MYFYRKIILWRKIMKKQRATKTLALLLALVMLVMALPMNAVAVDEEQTQQTQEELVTSTAIGLKDYSMPSTSKHAYDPFAQLESEEATKAYRDSVQYEEGKIIIKVTETKGLVGDFKEVADSEELEALGVDIASAQELSRKKVEDGLLTDSYEVIYVADLEGEVWEAVDSLSAAEGVVDAQPNFIYEDSAIGVPEVGDKKNPHLEKQWEHFWLDTNKQWKHLFDKGVTAGEGAVIAVIDTGVDYTHDDLAASMWVNTVELNGTPGVDDDGNGYIDDIHGVSTVGATKFHSGNPMDDHGHGTHVSGIIAMTANNEKGGVGISYGAKIMAIKAGQATGIFSDTDVAEAINYAVAMGADVINMSFGGTGRSFLVEEALSDAFASCVLVASAGNDGVPTSDAPAVFIGKRDIFPAGFSYVLGVMATGKNGNLASFSNWDYYGNGGSAEYEITAPGVDIWSTLPGNTYAMWDGTSMAAPMVAAAAALVRSAYPDRELYSSRFIMGQLASASKKTTCYTDMIGMRHVYTALDIEHSLKDLPKPNLTVKNTYLFDDPAIDPANDGDGIIDAGETIDLGIVIRNQWGVAKDVTVKVDAISTGGVANPNIEWIIDEISLENVGTFNEENNSFVYTQEGILTGVENPIRFKVKSDTINDAHIGFNITVTATNALDEKDKEIYTFDPDDFELSFFVQRGRAISGTIERDLVMTKDDYWIIENTVYIPEGVTVTVEPGTQIQFWSSDANDPYAQNTMAYIEIDGTFLAKGTEEEPIDMFPSIGFQNYGVDIRGGVRDAAHPLSTTLGTSELSYINIINPRLNFNKGDHLYIVQNNRYIYYRYLSSSGAMSLEMYSGGYISANKVSDSQIVNQYNTSYGVDKGFYGAYYNVLFDGCHFASGGNTTTSLNLAFYNCSFIGENSWAKKGATVKDPTNFKMPSVKFSQVYTHGDSKYVVLDLSGRPYYSYMGYSSPSGGGNKGEHAHRYYAINELAKGRGGLLAVPNTDEELDFLMSLVVHDPAHSSGTSYLLGGHKNKGETQYSWVDGNEAVGGYNTDSSYEYYAALYAYQSGNNKQGATASPFDSGSTFGCQAIFEYPATVSDEDILLGYTANEWATSALNAEEYLSFGKASSFENNAILNSFYETDTTKWNKVITILDRSYVAAASNNYFGTEDEKIISTIVNDADTYATLGDIVTDPILTLDSPELENIYPFVTEIYLTDTEGHRVSEVSYGQELTVHVKFNRDMDMTVQPMVTYGPAEPYTDYALNGDFVSPREWCAEFAVKGVIDAGMEFFRVKNAVAADDGWLKTGTDKARFAFEISRTGAQAMVLQAAGGENKVELEWMQDDYDTLAGFNVYRSTSENGTYTKLNSYLIPSTIREYVDTDVKPGVEYYYYFTVMGTDLVESKPSNISSASPIDNVKPVFTHSRITAGNTGTAIAFNVSASDNIAVTSVKIVWRPVGGMAWNEIEMTNSSGDDYFATLPGNYVTSAGIEYYVAVSDGVNTVYDGNADAPIRIAVDYSMVIYGVTPSKVESSAVAAGLTATLTGVNLADTMVLYVGGNVVEYEFIDSTQIRFTVPAGTIGRVDVKLVDGEREASFANAFTYVDASNNVVIGSVGEVMSKETVELPITVTASGDIYGVDLQLQLTKKLYSSIKFKKADGMLTAMATCSTTSAGVTKISIASDEVLPNGTVIGYLCLTTNSVTDPVSTTVNVVSALVNAVEVTSLSGVTLNIVPNFTVSGKITYYGSKTGMAGVTVTLNNGMTTVTDENGNYSFEGIKTSNVVVTPSFKGNVNGALSSQDASLVLQEITAESKTLTDHQFIAADVDGDGMLTALDAAYILRKTVGKITGDFPGTLAEWAFSEKLKVLSLTQNATNVNFTGILLGDVSGNWTSTPIEEVE